MSRLWTVCRTFPPFLSHWAELYFLTNTLVTFNHKLISHSCAQKPNLILNVDGFIGVAFVDLLRTCGGFTR